MNQPKQRDLSSFSNRFDFESNGFSTLQWEICVPQKHCLLWCVVLSYLRTADFSKNFFHRLRLLTKNSQDSKPIKISILKFNPFLNKDSYFFDKNLKSVVSSFKKVLEEFSTENLKYKQVLQVICNLLKCRIVLINNRYEDSIEYFEPRDDEPESVLPTLTLFLSDVPVGDPNKSTGGTPRFSFSLTKDLANRLREIALKTILKSAEISKDLRTIICDLVKDHVETTSIVITLLRHNLKQVVPVLFRSSYITHKLTNAGYITDPRVKDDDGFSAFYYALPLSEPGILYVLYNSADFRDPDSTTISNFLSLENIIDSDRSKSNDFETLGNKKERACLRSKELDCLNRCLAEISGDIHAIRQDPDDTAVLKVAKQKRIIQSILEIFNKYFFIGVDAADSGLTSLEHYMKYKTYYDNLDFTVTLLFCDNIFLLKGMLKLPKSLYSDLESSFLLTALCNKYFLSASQKVTSGKAILPLKDLCFKTSLYIIPMLERFQLRNIFTRFCECLKVTDIEENLVECVQREEIARMLSNWPEVRDEILISRLSHFMGIATKTKLTGNKLKMVIERALQVIGESLKVDEDNPNTLRFMLRSCLPEETVSTLTSIRNKLSSFKSFEFVLKLTAEKDDDLFLSIQSELVIINKVFKLVYEIQKRRLIEFLVFRGLEILKKGVTTELSDTIINYNKTSLEATMKYLNDSLNRKLTSVLFQKKYIFEIILSNLLKSTETRFKNIKNIENVTSAVEKVNAILWPLEYFLLFLRDKCKLSGDETLTEALAVKQRLTYGHLTTDALQQITLDFIIKSNAFATKLHDPSSKLEIKTDSIIQFNKILMGGYLSQEEQDIILEEIPQSVKNQIEQTEILKSCLSNRSPFPDVDIEKMFLNDKLKRELKKIDFMKKPDKALRIIIKTENPIKTLLSIFSKDISATEVKVGSLCDWLQVSNASRAKLLELVRSSKVKKPKGDSLYYLLDRIVRLKEISILEQPEIRELWRKGKSQKTKEYTAHKIVRHYFREPVFQATLEMLLFDCINILKESKALWIKTSHLFSGINVRNVLAHGDPLLETVGNLLDPNDLPSELVKKMLELLEDEDAIRAIHQLWEMRRDDFRDLIECPRENKFVDLRKRITNCERWKTYCNLITPEQRPVMLPSTSELNRQESAAFEENII